MAAMGLTLVQNVLVTGLILYRIWRARSPNASTGLTSIVYALVESGSLWVVTIVVWLVLAVKGSYGYNIILCCLVPVIGIVFTLLLVRVGIRSDEISRKSRLSNTTRSSYPSYSLQRRSEPVVISIEAAEETDRRTTSEDKFQASRSESITTAG